MVCRVDLSHLSLLETAAAAELRSAPKGWPKEVCPVTFVAFVTV